MSKVRKISTGEISQHDSPDNAWIVINGDVWDVTEFAPTHPGGADIINQYLGLDASELYNETHSPGLAARYLDKSKNLGRLDLSTVTAEWNQKASSKTGLSSEEDERIPLVKIINMYDFEAVAKQKLSAKGWAFYSGAANDCFTMEANREWYKKIWFRPQVLVGVGNVDTSTTVLGHKFDVPFFSSPAALAKLSHPDGELAIAKAAVKKGTTLCVSNNASYSIGEIMEVIPKGYPVFFQLYFNKDRRVTEELIKEINILQPRAILVTVDLPVVGKREADERIKIEASYKAAASHQTQKVESDTKGSGLARATGSYIDPNLCWKDIAWLQTKTSIPVFLKGIQCANDARRALAIGCKGIFISNHGGRAVDTAQPAILTLLEIQANCPEVLSQVEVFIDGGIRRGTDILKAICLGASACCLGRPFLYAVNYGQEGVEHAIESKLNNDENKNFSDI